MNICQVFTNRVGPDVSEFVMVNRSVLDGSLRARMCCPVDGCTYFQVYGSDQLDTDLPEELLRGMCGARVDDMRSEHPMHVCSACQRQHLAGECSDSSSAGDIPGKEVTDHER